MEIEDVQSSAPPTSPASTPPDMNSIAKADKSSPRSDDELAKDLRDVTDDSQVPLDDPQADSQVPDESQVPEDSQVPDESQVPASPPPFIYRWSGISGPPPSWDTSGPGHSCRYRSKAPSPHRELRKLQQGKARDPAVYGERADSPPRMTPPGPAAKAPTSAAPMEKEAVALFPRHRVDTRGLSAPGFVMPEALKKMPAAANTESSMSVADVDVSMRGAPGPAVANYENESSMPVDSTQNKQPVSRVLAMVETGSCRSAPARTRTSTFDGPPPDCPAPGSLRGGPPPHGPGCGLDPDSQSSPDGPPLDCPNDSPSRGGALRAYARRLVDEADPLRDSQESMDSLGEPPSPKRIRITAE